MEDKIIEEKPIGGSREVNIQLWTETLARSEDWQVIVKKIDGDFHKVVGDLRSGDNPKTSLEEADKIAEREKATVFASYINENSDPTENAILTYDDLHY